MLFGPFRIILPVAGYAILYPLLLKYSNLNVIGAWSLISSLIAIVAMGDIGFSQLLTRDAVGKEAIGNTVWFDYYAATRFYILLTGLLVIATLVSSIWLAPLLPRDITKVPLTFVILAVIIGAGFQLVNKLDSAILAAQHDFYTVQLVGIISQFFLFFPALIGVIIRVPLEGLACGSLISSLFSWFVVKRRVLPELQEVNGRMRPSWGQSFRHLSSQIIRGRHFYAISLAMLLRLPLSRIVIVSVAGLGGVAVFDIAMRVTQSIRDVMVNGLNVLLPAFNRLFKELEFGQLIAMAKKSLIALIVVGGLSITAFVLVADWFFKFWLGHVPEHLVATSLILAGWQLVTLLNVPFWFILLATGQERMASISVWCHTLLMLLAAPILNYFGGSVVWAAIYWAISSLLTQVIIYCHVQHVHQILWKIVGGQTTFLLLAITFLGFGAAAFHTYFGEQLKWSVVVVISLQLIFSTYIAFSFFIKKDFQTSRSS